MVQGELFEAALVSTIRPLGRICLVGFTAGQRPIRPGLLLIKQAVVIGSIWGGWAQAHPEEHQRNVAEILDFMASGAVTPRADRIYPLDRFIEAFELFERNEGRNRSCASPKRSEPPRPAPCLPPTPSATRRPTRRARAAAFCSSRSSPSRPCGIVYELLASTIASTCSATAWTQFFTSSALPVSRGLVICLALLQRELITRFIEIRFWG